VSRLTAPDAVTTIRRKYRIALVAHAAKKSLRNRAVTLPDERDDDEHESEEEESVAVAEDVPPQISVGETERHPDRRDENGYGERMRSVPAEHRLHPVSPGHEREPGRSCGHDRDQEETAREAAVVDPVPAGAAQGELEDRDRDAQAEVDQRECDEPDGENAGKNVGRHVRPGTSRLERGESDDAAARQCQKG